MVESAPAQAGVREKVPMADKWSLSETRHPSAAPQHLHWGNPQASLVACSPSHSLGSYDRSPLQCQHRPPVEAGCPCYLFKASIPARAKAPAHRAKPAQPPRFELPYRTETKLLPHCRRVSGKPSLVIQLARMQSGIG